MKETIYMWCTVIQDIQYYHLIHYSKLRLFLTHLSCILQSVGDNSSNIVVHFHGIYACMTVSFQCGEVCFASSDFEIMNLFKNRQKLLIYFIANQASRQKINRRSKVVITQFHNDDLPQLRHYLVPPSILANYFDIQR